MVKFFKWEANEPSFTVGGGGTVSSRTVGGDQGDSSPSVPRRWLLRRYLSAKKLHVSYSAQGVAHSVNQSEAPDFVKWPQQFLSHLLPRYMGSKILPSRKGNAGNKSEPSRQACPLVEKDTSKCSRVGVIQAD